jgi:hypothetical protein
MIRVNLLKNLGLSVGTGISAAGGEIVSVDVKRQALIKLVIILLFPLVFYIYEKLKVNALTEELNRRRGEVAAVEQERASFGDAGPRVEKANCEKRKIQRELDVIRGLARHRLREVKALDQLQSALPQGSWLKSIELKEGKVALYGYALNEKAIGDLLSQLSSNVYFADIEPKSTSAVRLGELGEVKAFEIDFRVGKEE